MKKPFYIDDGFVQRPYREDLDGWMEDQLDEREVPSLQMAKDILALYDEVNELRRENWRLRRQQDNFDKIMSGETNV